VTNVSTCDYGSGKVDVLRPNSIVDPRAVRDAFALSYERMGRLLDVSSRTVERMEAFDRPPRSAAVAEHLGQLAQIVELGQMVYAPEGWRLFLTLPQSRFGGLTVLPGQALPTRSVDGLDRTPK
jgi:hypothetical protein